LEAAATRCLHAWLLHASGPSLCTAGSLGCRDTLPLLPLLLLLQQVRSEEGRAQEIADMGVRTSVMALQRASASLLSAAMSDDSARELPPAAEHPWLSERWLEHARRTGRRLLQFMVQRGCHCTAAWLLQQLQDLGVPPADLAQVRWHAAPHPARQLLLAASICLAPPPPPVASSMHPTPTPAAAACRLRARLAPRCCTAQWPPAAGRRCSCC
jgi:hypothetical protein